MSDDSINLLCEYIEDSEIRYENMSRTQFFTNASFTIKVYPKDRYAIFNEDSWKYFSQTDGLKITPDDPEFFYTKLWQFDNE